MMTKVVVVDSNDRPIGLKSYSQLKYEDIYRVSALWLTDTATSDCLITQRKYTKHNDPGKWMAAVSGTIEEGETYDQNIIHEIEEEIGLTNLPLEKGPKEFIDDGKHTFFVQWYCAQVDKNKTIINIQEDEVEDYAWIPRKQLMHEVRTNPGKFVASLRDSLKLLQAATRKQNNH